MAELASGAVSSLLGVIQNEVRLLGRVQGDMQFIREEMESMNSFLQHLARTVPPDGRHDEQVRTWMNQVRLLAQDCNNFIDLYVYRENPDLHIGRTRPWRQLRWLPWFVWKYITQRSAAVELAKLKDRARDVGERRVRYGVDIPEKAGRRKSAAASGARLAAAEEGDAPAATGEEEEDEDGDDRWEATAVTDRRTTLVGPAGGLQDLDDYFLGKLGDWRKQVVELEQRSEAEEIPSIAIVAPNNPGGALALAKGAAHQVPAPLRSVMVDIPNVHISSDPPRTEDILCYIWRELELAHPLQQGTCQGEGEPERRRWWWASCGRRYAINREKNKAIDHVQQDWQNMLGEKIEDIKNKVANVKGEDELKKLNLLETDHEEDIKKKITEKSLAVLLCLLIKSADGPAEQDQATKETGSTSLAEWRDDIIEAASKKLRDIIYN